MTTGRQQAVDEADGRGGGSGDVGVGVKAAMDLGARHEELLTGLSEYAKKQRGTRVLSSALRFGAMRPLEVVGDLSVMARAIRSASEKVERKLYRASC